jgi:hypothetical protein
MQCLVSRRLDPQAFVWIASMTPAHAAAHVASRAGLRMDACANSFACSDRLGSGRRQPARSDWPHPAGWGSGDPPEDSTAGDSRPALPRGRADLSGMLKGPIFEPLRDPVFLSRGSLDEETRTLTWPNGADVAPEYLYFLAFRDDPDLADQFREWGYLREHSATSR